MWAGGLLHIMINCRGLVLELLAYKFTIIDYQHSGVQEEYSAYSASLIIPHAIDIVGTIWLC